MPPSLLGLTPTNDCAKNSDPLVAIRAIFIASLICVTVQHSKTENRGILPEMSNCYCHPGKAGVSHFWNSELALRQFEKSSAHRLDLHRDLWGRTFRPARRANRNYTLEIRSRRASEVPKVEGGRNSNWYPGIELESSYR